MYQLGQEIYQVFQEDSLNRSLELWKNAVRHNPKGVEIHYALAFGYLKQRRYGKAAQEARATLALNPDYPQAMMTLQAANRRFIGFGPVVVPDSLLDSNTVAALDHLEHGRWFLKQFPLDSVFAERAATEFRAAIALLPDNDPRGYVDLAGALQMLERYEEARVAVETAIQRDSMYSLAYQQLNRLHMAAGHNDSMIISSRENMRQSSQRTRERGTLLMIKVPSTATVQAGKSSIRVLQSPTITDNAASGEIMTVIRFAGAMAQSGYPEDGVLIMRQLARVHPEDALVWTHLAWVNFDGKRYAEAAKAWAKVEQLNPKYFDSTPPAKRDRDIAVKIAGEQSPMTVKDLSLPLSRFQKY